VTVSSAGHPHIGLYPFAYQSNSIESRFCDSMTPGRPRRNSGISARRIPIWSIKPAREDRGRRRRARLQWRKSAQVQAHFRAS